MGSGHSLGGVCSSTGKVKIQEVVIKYFRYCIYQVSIHTVLLVTYLTLPSPYLTYCKHTNENSRY